MENFEPVILHGLIENEDFMRKAFPYLKREYFQDHVERTLFTHIHEYIEKYNSRPTKEALLISVTSDDNMTQDECDLVFKYMDSLNTIKTNQNLDWLCDKAEEFCQNRAVRNAIYKTIKIYEGKEKNATVSSIPQLLMDAVAVSFDSNIGHDYIEQAEERFDFYTRKIDKIPFDLDMFNTITNDGVPKKTLNLILGGINVGKSLIMCHLAASYLSLGKNVLYITCEMAEEEISKRIDANLLNVTLDDIPKMNKNDFMNRFDMRIIKKTQGKLLVKEYPTSSAHVGHFRHLLNELKLKKKFVPDVLIIDYINICNSQRLRNASGNNSNTIVKTTAEEMRGLAVEFNVPIWTATQMTRGAQKSSDVDIDDTAESIGLVATVDFMVSIVETEELEQSGQFLVKQLKNRYRDKARNRKFVIGVDKAHQRLFDVQQPTNSPLIDSNIGKKDEEDIPLFDKGAFGSRMGRGGKERNEGFNFNC